MVSELALSPKAIPAYWTLTYELLFYLVCSGVFAWRVRRSWWGLGVAILILLVVIAYNVLAPLGGVNVGARIVLFMSLFGAGYASYRWVGSTLSLRRFRTLITLIFVLWVVVSAAGIILKKPSGSDDPTTICLAVSAFVGAILFALFLAAREKRFPQWATYLGEISYSIYLIHAALFVVNPFTGYAKLAFMLFGTVLLAPLTYRFIELPAIRFGRRMATTVKAR